MKKYFLITLFTCFSWFLSAQTMDELNAEYNKGAQALKAEESQKALDIFTGCLEMCDKIGADANEYKSKIEQIYPNLYYSTGMDLYKAKEIVPAIERLKEAIAVSEKYNDEKTKEKSNKVLYQLYSAQGNNMFKEADYDSAIACYNYSLEINPDYDKAVFGKGMSYKSKDDFENMKAAFDKLIELVGKEDKNAQTAIKILKTQYLGDGVQAINDGNYESSVENLKNALVYDDQDLSIYYFLAYSYNKLQNFDATVETCKKAIEKSGGVDSEDLSNIYFELGEASMSIGDNTTACDAYSKVITGKNVDKAARTKTEVLSCGQ
ncbi:MAG: hypothetical protein JXB49_28885 [Bacteroidales bacterium]|nr:hypothetical protein [Bacteroidales bacterium]